MCDGRDVQRRDPGSITLYGAFASALPLSLSASREGEGDVLQSVQGWMRDRGRPRLFRKTRCVLKLQCVCARFWAPAGKLLLSGRFKAGVLKREHRRQIGGLFVGVKRRRDVLDEFGKLLIFLRAV